MTQEKQQWGEALSKLEAACDALKELKSAYIVKGVNQSRIERLDKALREINNETTLLKWDLSYWDVLCG